MEFILKLSADISKSLSFLFILLYPFKAKMLQFVLERWGGVNHGKRSLPSLDKLFQPWHLRIICRLSDFLYQIININILVVKGPFKTYF